MEKNCHQQYASVTHSSCYRTWLPEMTRENAIILACFNSFPAVYDYSIFCGESKARSVAMSSNKKILKYFTK